MWINCVCPRLHSFSHFQILILFGIFCSFQFFFKWWHRVIFMLVNQWPKQTQLSWETGTLGKFKWCDIYHKIYCFNALNEFLSPHLSNQLGNFLFKTIECTVLFFCWFRNIIINQNISKVIKLCTVSYQLSCKKHLFDGILYAYVNSCYLWVINGNFCWRVSILFVHELTSNFIVCLSME